jgi:hypothetical protein
MSDLTAVIVNNSIFWDITPCSQFESQQTFRRTHVTSIFRVEEQAMQETTATCFALISYLVYSSTPNMEATCYSEMSVDSQRTTRRYIIEGGTPRNQNTPLDMALK